MPPNVPPEEYDFDHPNSLDFNGMYKCLMELVEGKETHTPVYCFKTHKRLPGRDKLLVPRDIIIFEGILCMHDERIRKLFDLKIFIHCDPDIALARRIRRDINERGRNVIEVLKRYNKYVKRDFDKYVKPQMKYVDFTIPGGASNDIAMDILVHNLRSRLNNNMKESAKTVPVEEQLKAALCSDVTKITASTQFQCLSTSHTHLLNLYLSLLQNDDSDDTKTSIGMLTDKLRKNMLQLISTDFNTKVNSIDDISAEIYCNNCRSPANAIAQPKCVIFVTTSCNNATVDQIITCHKSHKGLPIYCTFLFIEKEAIERLYKEVDLIKILCVYAHNSVASLADILRGGTNVVQFDDVCSIGDAALAQRFSFPNK